MENYYLVLKWIMVFFVLVGWVVIYKKMFIKEREDEGCFMNSYLVNYWCYILVVKVDVVVLFIGKRNFFLWFLFLFLVFIFLRILLDN